MRRFYSSLPRTLSEVDSFCVSGGVQKVVKHNARSTACQMTFAVYLPPGACTTAFSSAKKFPVVYWLSGLTCTEQNFITKAGAQRAAARLGLVVVCPDTSPRGEEAKVLSPLVSAPDPQNSLR